MRSLRSKSLAMGLMIAIVSLLLAGCQTTNPYTGEQQVNNTTKGGIVGAVGGGIIGALVDGGRGAAIGAAVGAGTGAVVGNSVDREKAELRRRLQGTGVQVVKEGDAVQLVMSNDVTFRLNSPNINSSFYPVLDSVAIVLKKYKRNNITVAGYTDNTGTYEYNQQLSEQRARSVADFLVSQGVSAGRVFTKGYGERFPVATNKSKFGRSENRRVTITLRRMA